MAEAEHGRTQPPATGAQQALPLLAVDFAARPAAASPAPAPALPAGLSAETLLAADAARWGHPEPLGRWMLGPAATLRLPGLAEPGSCQIELHVVPHVRPGDRPRFQDVTISLEGVTLLQLRLSGPERLRLPIPGVLGRPGQPMTLGFACPGAVAPAHLGTSRDPRVLGLCLRRLAVLQSPDKTHGPPPRGMAAFPAPAPAPLAPGPAPGAPLLAICAILRNEGRYIEEWLDHHHAVGVRRFVLYDNGSTDDMAARIAAWRHAGCVTLVPWLGFRAQIAAYQHMLATHRGIAEWCAFIDADEFIVPRAGTGLAEILAAQPDEAGGLFLHWLMFGSSGHAQYSEAPVRQRFTRRGHADFPPNKVGKCLVRLARAREARNPHIIACDGALLNDAGETIDQAGPGIHHGISHRLVALHHYFTKSAEEWRWRREGGRQDHDLSRAASEFVQYDVNAVEDRGALGVG